VVDGRRGKDIGMADQHTAISLGISPWPGLVYAQQETHALFQVCAFAVMLNRMGGTELLKVCVKNS